MPRPNSIVVIALSIFLLLGLSGTLSASIINVPDDQQTIQGAVDAAQEADTVLVQPGVYRENVTFAGVDIVVGSLFLTTGEQAYIDSTVIDGGAAAPVVRYRTNETEASILSGFTITNGRANYGGGVYINTASPTLDHLVITGNHAVRDGGGIYCTHNASPVFIHLTLTANTADRGSGSIYTFDNSSAVIFNSIIWGNAPAAPTAGQEIRYSDVEGGYAGAGNIDADPLFVDRDNGNFHLRDNSPCIDAGDPNSPEEPDGTLADIGAWFFFQRPEAHIVVTPDTLNFGNVLLETEVGRTITISNDGDADLIVYHPIVEGESFRIDRQEWDSITVESFDSLTIDAFFSPAELNAYSGYLTIVSNDPENDTLNLVLLGNGSLPSIEVVPDTLDFGVVLVDERAVLSFVVRNIGGVELTVDSIVTENGYFQLEFAGELTLNAGDSAQIPVTFAPLEAGDFVETVTIFSDDRQNPEATVTLVGTGGERAIFELGSIDTPRSARGIARMGNLIVVADSDTGLCIIDVSDPENPDEISSIGLEGHAFDVCTQDSLAFVACHEAGLVIVDFSNPAEPSLIGALDTPGMASGVAIAGSFVLVADSDHGLRVIDISDPAHPQEAGSCQAGDSTNAVWVSEDLAFVADVPNGLKIVDISDPENPRVIGSAETPRPASDIFVENGYAYLTSGENGVSIIDVSDPENPQVVTRFDTPGIANGVVCAGGLAYISDGNSGIQVFDITNIDNIELYSAYDTPGFVTDAVVNGSLCYVADYGNGVLVLDVSQVSRYPIAEIAPEEIDFGVQVTDHTTERSLTILNRGNWTLNILNLEIEGNYFSCDFEQPVSLEPMEEQTFVVSFTPGEEGDFGGTLTIVSDDPYEPEKTISLTGTGLVYEIIEEQGSLIEFFAGNEDGCEYDNWISHVSEGIARPGYNEYLPPELDRQTNGFGSFTNIDSLENQQEITECWYRIFTAIYQGDLDAARVELALSAFAGQYQMVQLTDGEKTYIILREILNEDYFDDNGTQDDADDVRGSFDLGWGLFIFDLEPATPNVIIEVPHPEDDFLAAPTGIDAFLTVGARAFFVAGANREVSWTEEGNYTNLKSFSDPTRMASSPFHQAHKAGVDLIDGEFVVQIHSYDTDAHPNLHPVELSTRLDYYPNRPVLDYDDHYDIVSLTPEVPIAANSSGHEAHDSVRVDDYYAVWYDVGFLGTYRYRNRLDISENVTMFASSWNQQMVYSFTGHDTLEADENWLHVEQDEFPNVITEDVLDYFSAGGELTWHNFEPAIDFYHPTYEAIREYYHHRTLRIVPDDFQSIQDAIDASADGDTVLVLPGTYIETVNFNGRNVILGSLFLTTGDPAYIDSTVIDGDRNGSVVRFDSGETNEALLTGFTIRNGSGSIDAENDISGGGVHCHDASPRLTYLKVLDNNAWYAAGIYCELGADAIIDRCLIAGNVAAIAGGGMDCYAASPTITNCTIVDNEAIRGGGLYLFDGCNVSISNTIFWDNSPQEVLYSLSGVPDTIFFRYCDVMGGDRFINTNHNGGIVWGEGNFDLDPEFTDPESDDYSLRLSSPCLDGGDPNIGRDGDDTWRDVGAIYTPYERTDRPRILIDATVYEFGVGEVDQDVMQSLLIRNTGYSTLRISEISLSGDHSDDFGVDFQQEIALDPAQSQTITITFRPSDIGARQAVLSVRSDDRDREVIEINLAGFGLNRQDRRLWYVPDDLRTIREAVMVCTDGDTVVVQPGEYFENIDFIGKDITIGSRYLLDGSIGSITGTIIHGDNSGGTAAFMSGETENARLSGLTITGGQDGVYCAGTDPVIDHCVIWANEAVNTGGAGFYCRSGASPQFINCTIVDNSARWGGGGYIRDGSGAMLNSCIIWSNNQTGLYSSGNGAQNRLGVNYTDVQGGIQGIVTNGNCQLNWGNGNLNSDPGFLDPDNGDFRLAEGSLCIDAGDSTATPDPDTTRTDMGALFYDHRPPVVPRILVSPDSLDFEPTMIGQSSEIELTIGNVGIAPLTVSNVIIEGEYFDVDFEAEFALEPDSSATVIVMFSPGEQGNFEGILTIFSDDPETEEFPVYLHGIGENDRPEIVVGIGDLSFDEDSGPWIVADLDTVFRDPNDDELTFTVEAEEPLQAEIVSIQDNDKILVIQTPDNFNGENLGVVVTAADNQGGRRAIELRSLRRTAIRDSEPIRTLRSVATNQASSLDLQQTSSSYSQKPSRDWLVDDAFTITVEPVNDAPMIAAGRESTCQAGDLIELEIRANDPDVETNGDEVQLTMIDDGGTVNLGATFTDHGDQTGTYHWQTDFGDIGDYELVFHAIDREGNFDLHMMILHVINGEPVVISEPPDLEVEEDTGPWIIADLDTVFEDPQGEPLFYSVDAPEPFSAMIEEETNILSIECPENFNGADLEISLTADDGHEGMRRNLRQTDSEGYLAEYGNHVNRNLSRALRSTGVGGQALRDASVTTSFLLTILPVNDPPFWTERPADTLRVVEGDTLRFDLAAADPDSDRIAISFDRGNLPNEIQFSVQGDGTASFEWIVGFERAGVYAASFSAGDGREETNFQLVIVVADRNRSPVIVGLIENVVVNEDCGRVVIRILTQVFRDPDGEALRYSVTGGEVEFGLGLAGDSLFLLPRDHYNHMEPLEVMVIATDSSDASASIEFTVAINPVNYPPGNFDLLSPVDGFRVPRGAYEVEFAWETSPDVDPEDSVIYRLSLQVVYLQVDTVLSFDELAETSLSLPLDSILRSQGIASDELVRVPILWWVTADDGRLETRSTDRWQVIVEAPLASEIENPFPIEFRLLSISPNPFNVRTTITYSLPRAEYRRLSICDCNGRTVAILSDGYSDAGLHSAGWNAGQVGTGLYFAVLETKSNLATRKIVLVK